MWLFEGKVKWFQRTVICKQSKLRVNLILHRVDSLICTFKNSNHLRSHLRARALDHSRLGLENKSGGIFCVRQVYFTKSCQQVWGRVNQPFIHFIHHIWGETVPWGAFFYHTDRGQNAVFHNFAIQIAPTLYSGQSKHVWAFSETIKKKNPKSTIRLAGSHFWQAPKSTV